MTPTSALDDDEVQRQHEAGNIRFHCNSDHWPLRRHLLGSRGGAGVGIQMGSPDCVVTPQQGSHWHWSRGGRMWADCPVNGADEAELWRTWAGAGAGADLSLVTRYNHRQLPTLLSSHAHWFYALNSLKNYLFDLSVMFSISFLLVSIRLPLRLRTSKRMSGVRVAVKVWHRWGVVRRASCHPTTDHQADTNPPLCRCCNMSHNSPPNTSHPVLVQPPDGGYRVFHNSIHPNYLSQICIDFQKFYLWQIFWS